MVHKVTALALSSLLITSLLGVAGAGLVDGGVQTSGNDTATITVSASGQAAAEADRAIVDVAAVGEGATADEATDALAADADRLRAALDDSNLSIDRVRTSDYHVREAREERNDSGYVARQSFEITLTDPDDAGATIDAAVANGASEVRGVQFTLSTERRQELRATAIDRAVADADNQATAVADSAELSLGEIQSISTSGDHVGPVTQAAAEDAADTEIDPGPVTVSASVEITYNASQ